LEKILDLLSKAAAVQQMSSNQQPQSTQKTSNTEAAPGRSDPNKYIYISKEDLAAIFPGLADKLDITKILSSLTSKSGLSKILSSLGGAVNIVPVENTSKSPEEVPKDNT
jgi:hypothetical protein